MKILSTLIISASFFIVTGCGGSSIIVNEKYKDQDYSNRSILIMPFPEEVVTVHNKDDVYDDFEEDRREPEAVIKDFLFKSINENAGISLKGIKIYEKEVDSNLPIFRKDTLKYFSISKRIGEDSILYKFYVPIREVLNSSSEKPEIVLVINKLTFGRNYQQNAPMYVPGNTVTTPGGSFTTPGHFTGGGSSEFLGASVEFIIYDYNEGDVITAGKADVQVNFMFAMTRSTWSACFEDIADGIFKDSPFKWTKYYFKKK
ncbi:MAG: hypothetical protein ACM339_02990 [Ignavibacteria bacterium]